MDSNHIPIIYLEEINPEYIKPKILKLTIHEIIKQSNSNTELCLESIIPENDLFVIQMITNNEIIYAQSTNTKLRLTNVIYLDEIRNIQRYNRIDINGKTIYFIKITSEANIVERSKRQGLPEKAYSMFDESLTSILDWDFRFETYLDIEKRFYSILRDVVKRRKK